MRIPLASSHLLSALMLSALSSSTACLSDVDNDALYDHVVVACCTSFAQVDCSDEEQRHSFAIIADAWLDPFERACMMDVQCDSRAQKNAAADALSACSIGVGDGTTPECSDTCVDELSECSSECS